MIACHSACPPGGFHRSRLRGSAGPHSNSRRGLPHVTNSTTDNRASLAERIPIKNAELLPWNGLQRRAPSVGRIRFQTGEPRPWWTNSTETQSPVRVEDSSSTRRVPPVELTSVSTAQTPRREGFHYDSTEFRPWARFLSEAQRSLEGTNAIEKPNMFQF